jgi:hypothetical protein
VDSFEKLQRAIALKPTPKIPVYPHIVTFAGRCAGITQERLFSSNQAWLDAYDKTIARVGKPDVVFPLNPFDTAYIESMRVKLPGKELGLDEPFQFVEDEFMLASEYDVILQKGWNAWNARVHEEDPEPAASRAAVGSAGAVGHLPEIMCPTCEVRGTVSVKDGTYSVARNADDVREPRFSGPKESHHLHWIMEHEWVEEPKQLALPEVQEKIKAYNAWGNFIVPPKKK